MTTVPQINPSIDWPSELERHREWMQSIASARLCDSHAADDVVQDAALAVIRHNGRPTDASKIRSWLYQVVVRRCADFFRREAGESRRAYQWAERAGIEEGTSSDWVMAAERQHLLRQALAQLPEDDRRVFLMRYSEGRGYRELAEEFGVTERVVEYRLRRAKQQLRVKLRVFDEDK